MANEGDHYGRSVSGQIRHFLLLFYLYLVASNSWTSKTIACKSLPDIFDWVHVILHLRSFSPLGKTKVVPGHLVLDYYSSHMSLTASLKGPGGMKAAIMPFGGTGSHKYVLVRLIEISTRWRYQMVFYYGILSNTPCTLHNFFSVRTRYHFTYHWYRDLFLCDTVQIRRYLSAN